MNIRKGKGKYYNKNEDNGDALLTTPKLMMANQLPHILYIS